MVVAALIALPATRAPGLFLGAAIILAATATVVRHCDLGHLSPLGVFAVALGMAPSRLYASSRESVG